MRWKLMKCCCDSGDTNELKIEGDVGADPIWCNRCCCNLDIGDIPISHELAEELSLWAMKYGEWIDWNKDRLLLNGIELEDEFNQEGIALTEKVRKELGDKYKIQYSLSTSARGYSQNSLYIEGGKEASCMNKKPKIKSMDILNQDDIWNVVSSVLLEYGDQSENKIANEAFTVLQYYSEMESGGHESFLRWNSEHIEEIGITIYMEELIGVLEKIAAHEYALIEKKYGKEMWRLYVALENDEIDEKEFYSVIEKADNEYYNLNEKLRELLEDYFVMIHKELIEVVED